MRLTDDQHTAIKRATVEIFGPSAVVRLFGSRADDARLGGDIDLHIEAPEEVATLDGKVRFQALLFERLDEPQIDVVLASRGRDRWIDRAARRDGIVL